MLVYYNHLSWFIFLFTAFLFSSIFTFYVLFSSRHFFLSISLFIFDSFPLKVRFFLDWMSMSFMTTVLLIRTVVMVYSYNYIAPYSKSVYFLWTTILFVLSMLLVVTMSNLFFIILGWDGLGLVSFFLIVYYQNASSVYSGLFTLLINRIGDCFFLVTIAMFFYCRTRFFTSSYVLIDYLLVFLMVTTFITKSAIYPFSPWLPLAMAAPTPISALVHSSTLVTAGLYLIMRYSYYLYYHPSLIKLLLILSLFTSFYAGINAIFEMDLKKLIALSTLSHLGFIGLAFSSGLLHLSFFHLLTHAMFKSLLFMTIGDIIINLNHSQDIRYLSSGVLYTPFSCYVIYLSLFNLLGLPNLRGFFSKDLVLEMSNYSLFSSSLLVVLYLNLFFTYFYTFQLFYYSFQNRKVFPYQLIHHLGSLHSFLLLLLGVLSLLLGKFFMSFIYPSVILYPLPSFLKFFPPILMFLVFLYLFFNKKQLSIKNSYASYYFSTIMFLLNIMSNLSSTFFYKYVFMLVRRTELGALNYFMNTYFRRFSRRSSVFILSQSSLKPLNFIAVSFVAAVFIYLFFLSNNIINYRWLLPIKSLFWVWHRSYSISYYLTFSRLKWIYNPMG